MLDQHQEMNGLREFGVLGAQKCTITGSCVKYACTYVMKVLSVLCQVVGVCNGNYKDL